MLKPSGFAAPVKRRSMTVDQCQTLSFSDTEDMATGIVFHICGHLFTDKLLFSFQAVSSQCGAVDLNPL